MTTFLRRVLWPAFALLVAMTLITGVAYPAVVTAVAQVAFPHQANGSMIVAKDGRTVGSSLIGQAFAEPTVLLGPARRPPGRPTTTRATTPAARPARTSGRRARTCIDRVAPSVDRLRGRQRRRARSRWT